MNRLFLIWAIVLIALVYFEFAFLAIIWQFVLIGFLFIWGAAKK